MERKAILTKAIERAHENGFLPELNDFPGWNVHKLDGFDGRYLLCLPDHETRTKRHIGIAEVIYAQDFAYALWGKAWKRHLQQMVVDDDPIKYLEPYVSEPIEPTKKEDYD